MYGNHMQGVYQQPPIDNGPYQTLNPGSSPYYHQMQHGSYAARPQQQFPVAQQEAFVPYGAKSNSDTPKIEPSHSSFLAIRGQELLDFCISMVKIDPYISAEACKEILEQKFPELASNKYKVTFGALMSYYKSSKNCHEVPPDNVVMLSTIADAMNLSVPRGKRPISDEGDSINNMDRAAAPALQEQPKRKRGRPRKQPDPLHPLGKEPGEVSKSGEMAISIMCNGKPGLFRLYRQTCDCFCDVCKLLKKKLGVEEIDMSPKEFERHAGMGHMKKWRSSILVNNPVYKGTHGKSLGAFLALKKVEAKSIQGIHDSCVRTYAVPPAKGVPASVTQSVLEKLGDEEPAPFPPKAKAETSSSTDEEHLTQTEAPPQDAEPRMKRKVGRPRKLGLSKEAKRLAVNQAKHDNKLAEIVSWKILDSLNISLEVSYGSARFSGVLELVKIEDPKQNKVGTPLSPQPKETAKEEDPFKNRIAEESPSTSPPKPASKINSSKSPTSHEQGSHGQHPLTCNLCGGPNEESTQNMRKGYFGRTDKGLGKLKSIKVNSASTTWVHDQCARWSPEVHDPTGAGTLVGIRDAIVRGRRLKCKLCGKKGATIGCFSKRCKSSFHLPCAREVCVLKANPYFVCCQDHKADFFPDDPEK